MSKKYKDFEIIGTDTDGCLLQWDASKEQAYNCGESPKEFGLDNITDEEKKRLTK